MYRSAQLTADQKYALEVARTGFMSACPFFAHYFFAEMKEVYTKDIPTACTDGRRIYINPDYVCPLKPAERVFVYAHEVAHVICQHPSRLKHYAREGNLRGMQFSTQLFNVALDYVINADLVGNKIGLINPSWLYDPDIKATELAEDVYAKLYKQSPPPSKGGGGEGDGQGEGPTSGKGKSQGQGKNNQPSTYGSSGRGGKGAKGDPVADGRGGSFDEVLEPQVDDATGREDLPDQAEFREAIARAAAAAKAMGRLPASMQRLIDEILDPQVDWREHLRMMVTGRVGRSHETWARPDRRRIVLNPQLYMPGRRGHGADTVAVAVDTSGSIGEKELSTFFAEIAGILADVHPKNVVLLWCDARLHRVDEARNMEELMHARAKGAVGGGGTSFVPVFEELAKPERGRVDALVYLTDMMGEFPSKKPAHPVIWCATTDQPAPFGDVVRIQVK